MLLTPLGLRAIDWVVFGVLVFDAQNHFRLCRLDVVALPTWLRARVSGWLVFGVPCSITLN